MSPSLRQLVKVAERLQAGVAQLQASIAALIAAGAQPKSERPSASRKAPWTGPVPGAIRKQRQEAWGKRSQLAIELGVDPRPKYFGVMHNLHPCLVSRWLTEQQRSIAPGSVQDQNMWRMVNEDSAKFENLLAKRHGGVQIANSAQRISATMTA